MAVTRTGMARITSKGQITVPKEVRDRLGVDTGDALEFWVDDAGQRAEVRPIRRRSIAEFRGLFKTDRRVDEPFDWGAEREDAWRSATQRLVPKGRAGG